MENSTPLARRSIPYGRSPVPATHRSFGSKSRFRAQWIEAQVAEGRIPVGDALRWLDSLLDEPSKQEWLYDPVSA